MAPPLYPAIRGTEERAGGSGRAVGSDAVRIREDSRRWWVLTGACFGLFILMLDSTIVNVALPALQRDLGASAAELQWVVNAYLLVMAAATVTMGRLGDLLGRKRVFQAGMLVFVAGSIVAATAANPFALVLGRL